MAGEYGQNHDPRIQGGYPPPQMYQQPQPAPMAPFTIAQVATGSMQPSWPEMKFSTEKLDKEVAGNILGWQTAMNGVQVAGNIGLSIANAFLASEGMQKQFDLQKRDFDLRDKVALYQKEVALGQLDNQRSAIDTQNEMHQNQISHEQEMRKLEGNTQERLARIAESGKTERARFLSVSDAFNRRDYSNGVTV